MKEIRDYIMKELSFLGFIRNVFTLKLYGISILQKTILIGLLSISTLMSSENAFEDLRLQKAEILNTLSTPVTFDVMAKYMCSAVATPNADGITVTVGKETIDATPGFVFYGKNQDGIMREYPSLDVMNYKTKPLAILQKRTVTLNPEEKVTLDIPFPHYFAGIKSDAGFQWDAVDDNIVIFIGINLDHKGDLGVKELYRLLKPIQSVETKTNQTVLLFMHHLFQNKFSDAKALLVGFPEGSLKETSKKVYVEAAKKHAEKLVQNIILKTDDDEALKTFIENVPIGLASDMKQVIENHVEEIIQDYKNRFVVCESTGLTREKEEEYIYQIEQLTRERNSLMQRVNQSMLTFVD